MSEVAELPHRGEDAPYYRGLSLKGKKAWRSCFVSDNGGRIEEDKQDDYVRAIWFRLLPENQQAAVVGMLVELIQQTDYHLGAGFLSALYLIPTLCEHDFVK